MNTVVGSPHGLSNIYLVIILLLAMGSCTFGLVNLSSAAFRIPDYQSDIEQSDRFVIGLFNVVISVVAIYSVVFIAM